MYRVDGSSDWWRSRSNTGPATAGRARSGSGNGAAEQLQLDIYGEAFDSPDAADQDRASDRHRGWTELAGVLDWLVDNWDQPEEGIWETRGGRRTSPTGGR
jgi:GH15 family glucan-1,4-alpha-glucosidase